MIYVLPLTVPPNTSITLPLSAQLKLSACHIKHVIIDFPRGCYYLTGTKVYYNTHQIIPNNPDEWISSEGQPIEWNDAILISDSPYQLAIFAYNLDTIYSHTLRYYVEAISLTGPDVVVPTLSPSNAYLGI